MVSELLNGSSMRMKNEVANQYMRTFSRIFGELSALLPHRQKKRRASNLLRQISHTRQREVKRSIQDTHNAKKRSTYRSTLHVTFRSITHGSGPVFFLSQEFSILSQFLSELPCPLSFHQIQTDVAAQITPSRRLSSSAASFARVKFPADEERVHSVNTLTQATGVEQKCNLNTHDTSDQFT